MQCVDAGETVVFAHHDGIVNNDDKIRLVNKPYKPIDYQRDSLPGQADPLENSIYRGVKTSQVVSGAFGNKDIRQETYISQTSN